MYNSDGDLPSRSGHVTGGPALERPESGFAMVLQQLGRALPDLGMAEEDRISLPQAIARAVDAQWIVFRERGGDWAGWGREGNRTRLNPSEAIRRVDFGLLARLPRDRMVRLAGRSLGRSARFAGCGLSEILVHLESAGDGIGSVAVIALGRPPAVAMEDLDAVIRAWIGSTALRSRIRRDEESGRQQEMEARALCALHDLRHELTVASLELDRVTLEPGRAPAAGVDRIRAAIARARALCESELGPASPIQPSFIRVEEVLRTEANAARSVSGRSDSIGIEVRCEADLEFPVDRGMLSRIVRNLVLNAIQNSPDGERVRIEAERGPQAGLVLRVIDQGRGMSAVDREELSRFGRSGRGGFGIGSASIATCARSIGARARIDSRLGAGTWVEVFVPAAGGLAPPRRPAPRNPRTPADTRG